jgi:hypothetical protein
LENHLVDLRADAIVDGPHGLGAGHARKVELLHVVGAQARAARDDGRRGLGGHVVAEGGVARLARDADHARQRGRPLVEVGLVLKGQTERALVARVLSRTVLGLDIPDAHVLAEGRELVGIDCAVCKRNGEMTEAKRIAFERHRAGVQV